LLDPTLELEEEKEQGLDTVESEPPDGEFMLGSEELTLTEETLELDREELAVELAEDPVRLYLREIGQVKLLDAASEFRLAAIIEGRRLIHVTRRRGEGDRKKRKKIGDTQVYHMLMSDLLTAWKRLGEDSERLKVEMMDAGLLLSEAQTLHRSWQSDVPSYV
jgi:RNA polymerase primary sigma factor